MVVAIVVVSLITLFSLFLHLYAKWFWWRIEEPPVPRAGRRRRGRRFVFTPGQETSLCAQTSKGLDAAVLGSLPVIFFQKQEFGDEDGLECAVCLCEVVDGETARILPKCSHGFHVDCIDMWFQSHVTCPLCRNPVVSSESAEFAIVIDNDAVDNAGTENLGPGYQTDTPRFPANVLFWGDETQVNSVVACLEESASSASMVIIDAAPDEGENENVVVEEESKYAMPTKLKTLKRMLSRERRAASTSNSSSHDAC